MARRSFAWRGESYRLDNSTWHFWGHARLIQTPGEDAPFSMTPDDLRFIRYAIKEGYAYQGDLDTTAHITACQAYLEQHGHQVWTVWEALQVLRDDADTDLSARLLERLIYWFFISKY